MASEGDRQAEKLAKRLHRYKVKVVYASEYARSIETAEILAKQFGARVKIHKALNEIGVWASPTQLHSPTFSPREYEEELGIVHRAQEQAIEFLEALSHQHAGERVVVVAHGNIIRGIIAEALKAGVETVVRMRVNNASLSILEHEEKGDYFRLILFNDTSHL